MWRTLDSGDWIMAAPLASAPKRAATLWAVRPPVCTAQPCTGYFIGGALCRETEMSLVVFAKRLPLGISLCERSLVLQGRIELPTSSLPRTRSATELLQHACGAVISLNRAVAQGLSGRLLPPDVENDHG